MVAFKEVPMENIIPLRERLREGTIDLSSFYPEEEWDYLTLYDQGGNVLARSKSASDNAFIYMRFRDLTFISTPGYDGNETVSVEWNSLLQATA